MNPLLIATILSILTLHCNIRVICASQPSTTDAALQIWIDEYVFSQGETNLVQKLITATANDHNNHHLNLSLAGTTKVKYFQPKGHKMLHKHDFLWTARHPCYQAFNQPTISYTNAISCLPGTQSITGKSSLIHTLQQAYTSSITDAIMPRSFLLPSQYYDFAEYLHHQQHTSTAWILKEDVHRGSGVVPVSGSTESILRRAAEKKRIVVDNNNNNHHSRRHTDDSSSSSLYSTTTNTVETSDRFVLAQQFITDQLLIEGRPFTVRLWAVLAGGDSVVRAYLYKGGILPFGGHAISSSSNSNNTNTTMEEYLQSMIVNIFQQDRSKAKDPWSIDEFKQYIESTLSSLCKYTNTNNSNNNNSCWQQMWSAIETSTAAVLAAAIPGVRSTLVHHTTAYQGGGIEVLGLDFVVDSKLKPWLVEVNYLPSMARKVINCIDESSVVEVNNNSNNSDNNAPVCKKNAMDEQKEAFLRAHFKVAAARRAAIEQHSHDAQSVFIQNSAMCNNSSDLSITADVLRQVMDSILERKNAVKEGFSDLTPLVYRAMSCIASSRIRNYHHYYGSNNTSDNNDDVCAFLETILFMNNHEQNTCSSIHQDDVDNNQGSCTADTIEHSKVSATDQSGWFLYSITKLQTILKRIRLIDMYTPRMISSIGNKEKKAAQPYMVLTPIDQAIATILSGNDSDTDIDNIKALSIYNQLCQAHASL